MKHFVVSFIALTLTAGLPVCGQAPPDPGEHFPPGPRGFGPDGPRPHMRPGKLVTGAPYSATLTNERIEHLPDGNTIQRTVTGHVARDSQGRTYEQQTITGGPLAQDGPLTITFISDPVAGYTYRLNSKDKTAVKHAIRQPQSGGHPEGRLRAHAHENSPNVTETDLAADSSTGVTAQGKRITRTIAAGEIGNAQPIVSTSDTWYSPELQIVVKAVRNDPRMGQSTYALTNIVTKEPDASLFQVPTGYNVKDTKERRVWGRPGAEEAPRPPLE
jgi:hypothetical protein